MRDTHWQFTLLIRCMMNWMFIMGMMQMMKFIPQGKGSLLDRAEVLTSFFIDHIGVVI